MKKGNQKRAYELFAFSLLGFEIGANRFSIKFCIRQPNSFFSKIQVWYQEKQPNLKIQSKFFCNALCDLQLQNWKMLEPKCFLQIYKILSDFDSNPLIWDPTLFPGKNSLNTAKSNRVFPENGRGDRALVLTYLDSPMAEVFPHYCLSFSISAIFRVKRVVTVGPKMQTLGPSVFHENSNPSYFFQIMFQFARVLTLVRISTRRRVRAQRTSKKGHFMDAKSVRKTLKTFNLTTTNAILMKLTTIMDLHESVN